MKETGKIIKLKGDKAVIRIDRKSACDKCRMCAIKPRSPHIDIALKNEAGAKTGDIVEVEMADHIVIKSSLFVYIIPLITAFVGLLIGLVFDKAVYQLIMFAGFLLIGFVIVFFVDKLVKNNKKYQQRITRIVLSENIQNDKEI